MTDRQARSSRRQPASTDASPATGAARARGQVADRGTTPATKRATARAPAPARPAAGGALASTEAVVGRLRHREDFAGRRARLGQRMNQLGGGVAVVFTAPEVIRNRDAHYPYRADSQFHYLCGFPEPEAALVIVADGRQARSILFCRPKNVEREIWDGLRFGPAAARKQFGFDEAFPIEELDQQMARLLVDQPTLFHAVATDGALDGRVRGWLAAVRAQSRAGFSAPSAFVDLDQIVDEMRLFKDAEEIAIMRDSAAIAAEAHCAAMRMCRPGLFEYQIEAELLKVFQDHGAAAPAYGSIVAGGANACILHYRENDQRLKAGQLLLIDAGCELDGYASDITRTFPVDGRFTGPQRDVYEIVLASQKAAQRKTRPGRRFDEAHEAAVAVLARGLVDLKLLKGSVSGVIESGAYRRFYMHRTGHWLGRDVHDVGDYREAAARSLVAAGDPARSGKPTRRSARPAQGARPWRRLEPGMVITIEPGLYIRAASDVPKAFHDIGIRIEDDALVTPGGCDLITAGVPKACADIEALMRD